MLSRRYIEDVEVEVLCEEMIRMDRIKTTYIKLLSVKSSTLNAEAIISHSHEL